MKVKSIQCKHYFYQFVHTHHVKDMWQFIKNHELTMGAITNTLVSGTDLPRSWQKYYKVLKKPVKTLVASSLKTNKPIGATYKAKFKGPAKDLRLRLISGDRFDALTTILVVHSTETYDEFKHKIHAKGFIISDYRARFAKLARQIVAFDKFSDELDCKLQNLFISFGEQFWAESFSAKFLAKEHSSR